MRQRSGNPRVSVVVPTRNEARNLEVVLPAIAAVRPAVHEIIVVDGNSVDGSVETARRVLPWVRVVHQTRKGKGNAMACGFAEVTGEVIVMFDADGSADPAEIPAFVRALIEGADFAKGSRFVRGGGSDDITLLRKSGNAGLNGVANALFGTSYTDLCYGYNAFWADLLPTLDLPATDLPAPADGSMLWGDGFEIETVLNCRVAAAGLKITEVPSVERERIFGTTNLRTFADGTRVLRTLAAERKRATQRKAERVEVELSSRALTPPGGIPIVAPERVAAPPPQRTATPAGGVAVATASTPSGINGSTGVEQRVPTSGGNPGSEAGDRHGERTSVGRDGERAAERLDEGAVLGAMAHHGAERAAWAPRGGPSGYASAPVGAAVNGHVATEVREPRLPRPSAEATDGPDRDRPTGGPFAEEAS